MRRLLALLLVLAGMSGVAGMDGLAAGGAAAAAAPARSCPAPLPLRQALRQADAVFTGTVTGRTTGGGTVRYAVDVQRSYSGRLDEGQTVATPRSARSCGLTDLQRGGDYVFVTVRDGDTLTTTSRLGTAPATRDLVRRVEGLLGQGEGPASTEPVRATFTPVAGDATPLARLVAPGLALVLAGLLGLVLAAALGRRRA